MSRGDSKRTGEPFLFGEDIKTLYGSTSSSAFGIQAVLFLRFQKRNYMEDFPKSSLKQEREPWYLFLAHFYFHFRIFKKEFNL